MQMKTRLMLYLSWEMSGYEPVPVPLGIGGFRWCTEILLPILLPDWVRHGPPTGGDFHPGLITGSIPHGVITTMSRRFGLVQYMRGRK
jgi:hypothetical protein